MHENLRTDFEVFGLLEFIVVVVILYDVLNVVLIMEIGRFLAALLGDGLLEVPILATFPLEDAAGAYARFAEGSKLGKIILTT